MQRRLKSEGNLSRKARGLPHIRRQSRSDVEIQRKLPWMGAQANRVDLFLSLVSEPCFDHIGREDSAFEQKIVVLFQRIKRLIDRTRHRLDLLCLLGR